MGEWASCEPCGKGEAMAGGKEGLAAILHSSVRRKDGVRLEGFGKEVKDFKVWVGLHCSIASFSVHIPSDFIARRFVVVFVFSCHIVIWP